MLTLTATQKDWNNQTLEYDVKRFDWPRWCLEVVREIEPDITEFETMHQKLTPSRIQEVLDYVQQAFSRREFMERFDAFAAEYLAPRVAGRRYLVQRKATMAAVIPDQDKVGRRLTWHQGIFVGNGRGMRKIWSPLTRAHDSNTVWFMDVENSRDVSRQVLSQQWSLDRFENECEKRSKPINLEPGQSHLFLMEALHGNVNNDTGYTRVSFDWGILVEGEEWNQRLPAGFYRLPGDYQQDEPGDPVLYAGKTVIGFISMNNEYTRGIPKPLQRIVVEQYCNKHGIRHNGHQFENDFFDWLPSLEHFILQRPDVIVLYSLYGLPEDAERRNYLLNLAVDNGVELHFANEASSLKSAEDLERIRVYADWPGRAKMSPHSWEV